MENADPIKAYVSKNKSLESEKSLLQAENEVLKKEVDETEKWSAECLAEKETIINELLEDGKIWLRLRLRLRLRLIISVINLVLHWLIHYDYDLHKMTNL